MQLAVAIALYVADLESAAQIAIVITLLERVLIAIEHQAPNIALVDLKEVVCALEGMHIRCCQIYCAYEGRLFESTLSPNMASFNCYCTCPFASPNMQIGLATHLVRCCKERLIGTAIGSIANVSSMVWLPIYGYFHGDHWLRQIASQVTLTFRGNENTEDGLAPFYWILVLPSGMIASLVQGLRTDISTLPMGQANPCMTLSTALAKALHWVRQGHIDANAELSALVWRPTIASTSAELKTETGRGGQAYWRNVSYIGATYCGIATADGHGLWGLTNAEIENCFSINLRLTARQCSTAFLHDCYSGTASSGLHRHLVFPIALSTVEQLSTIGTNGEEEAIGHHIAPASAFC